MGLTIIDNTPNPAGIVILRSHFDDEAVHRTQWGCYSPHYRLPSLQH